MRYPCHCFAIRLDTLRKKELLPKIELYQMLIISPKVTLNLVQRNPQNCAKHHFISQKINVPLPGPSAARFASF